MRKKDTEKETEEEKLDVQFLANWDVATNRHLFGVRVAKIRHEHGLNQEKFAEKLRVSRDTVRDVEQGKRLLSIEFALQIHKHFGYSLDYIYGLSDVPETEEKKFFYDIREVFRIEEEILKIRIDAPIYKYLQEKGDLDARKKAKAFKLGQYQVLLAKTEDAVPQNHKSGCAMYCGDIPCENMKPKLCLGQNGKSNEIDIVC